MELRATTSQTVGPFFSIGLSPRYQTEIAVVSGERVTIQGQLLDGDGEPVPDAVIETWQADAHGKYAHPEARPNETDQDKPIESGFFGFGRIPTDSDGRFSFSTIKPGPVPAPDGTLQAPHILVSIFMRGLLMRLITRIYFFGDPGNENDFALKLVEPARRSTLMARPTAEDKDVEDKSVLIWNVYLQGESETVFFDF
jgi:protocatechuate 3,4-dioxygenase, alpha subunit